MSSRLLAAAVALSLGASAASAATLSQTIHFPGASAEQLYRLYLSADGQEQITGFPARYVGADSAAVDTPQVGDSLAGFCFAPDQCGLSARILNLSESEGAYGVTMAGGTLAGYRPSIRAITRTRVAARRTRPWCLHSATH